MRLYILKILFYLKSGDEEAFDKFARRTVKVTREHNEECKRLLKVMGIPYVDAPTEAEARKFYFIFLYSIIVFSSI